MQEEISINSFFIYDGKNTEKYKCDIFFCIFCWRIRVPRVELRLVKLREHAIYQAIAAINKDSISLMFNMLQYINMWRIVT